MPDEKQPIDPIPDEFASAEQAAEFWDTHSVTDYDEWLEPIDVDVDIERRHFEIEVDEATFHALREFAQKQRKPAQQLANEIIKQHLAAG